jgi:hypothetical protein
LPFLAVMRAMWEFFGERIQFEPWKGEAVPVEVELEEERPVKPAAERPVRVSGPGEGVRGTREVPPADSAASR